MEDLACLWSRGVCFAGMFYLCVHKSLFAGQWGVDFLSVSAPVFGAQRCGDKSKIIHYWFRINIQDENINSQPKKRKCKICQNAQTKNEKKKSSDLTRNFFESFIWVHYFTRSCRLVSAFCLVSVLIFIMIFLLYRKVRAEGCWRAACCFWLFFSLSFGFKMWIWIFMMKNNGGYKNKSLQSQAVSYRGKQCLPHQRSLEMLTTIVWCQLKPHSSPS